MEIGHVSLEQTIRYSFEGSWRAGTREGRCLGLETTVHVESREAADRVRELLTVAERACFTMHALANRIPVETCATLNGEPLPR
jgi:organic hydroperoxide reductase OsmC/OhrA